MKLTPLLEPYMIRLRPWLDTIQRGETIAFDTIGSVAGTTIEQHPGLEGRVRTWLFSSRGIRTKRQRKTIYLLTATEQATQEPVRDMRLLRRSGGRAHARCGVVPALEIPPEQRSRHDHLSDLLGTIHAAAIRSARASVIPVFGGKPKKAEIAE